MRLSGVCDFKWVELLLCQLNARWAGGRKFAALCSARYGMFRSY